MKLVILGAGSISGGVARLLSSTGGYDSLVIADLDLARATDLAGEVGGQAVRFDATDPQSITDAIAGADVVFNAVGPFYRFGMPIIRAAIAAGVNYVDVCDEFDVAEQLVGATDLDEAARAAGVSVVFGMGFAPGITSLIGRWAVESLDTAHSVDVTMAIPYVVNMGATINEHMLHSMSGDVRQFLDGAIRATPAWGDPQAITFGAPFDTTVRAGYMGHPEGITLGTYLPGLRNATVRFTWFEQEGNEVWQTFERLGLTDPEVLAGTSLSPRQFLARFMASEAGQRRLAVPSAGMPGTTMRVTADGEIDGVPARAVFETQIIYGGRSGQDPTPIAAAAAVREMLAGRITRTGLMSPEACLDPKTFVPGVLEQAGVGLTQQITTAVGSN